MTDNAGALFESSIPGYPLIGRGKVRDIYSIDDEHLLIVTTDRLSAFDVVMPDPVPGKGEVLTQISLYWFRMMEEIIENQLTSRSIDEVIEDPLLREQLRRRSLVVKRLKPLPIEAVARGYLIGSGWKDYRESGEICGIPLPPGLRQAERLPETLFTPASKAEAGDAAHALQRGIIIADTKFEFGLDHEGRLYLIDEVLTPDSSRFWPVEEYEVGMSPPSFDKQFVRDYLETLDWDKTAPGPELPSEVIQKTAEKYREALRRLTQA
jgi:phosphoribosylaminoimidazole-succinocarboxamide synthase